MSSPKAPKGKLRKIFAAAAVAVVSVAGLAGCANPSDVVSDNLSKAADNYRINRQVDVINTVTGEGLLSIKGLCSMGNDDTAERITVTCKTGENKKGEGEYIKDIIYLPPTVTVLVQQLGTAEVSSAHYSITVNPGSVIPDFNQAGGAPLTPPATTPGGQANANADASTPQVKVVPVPMNRPAPTTAPG